jgi:hypothetical protein
MRRSQSEKDKKLRDDARLLRAWRNWHAEQLTEALTGLHRDVLGRVMAQLKDLRSARELVTAMAAEDWSVVDADTRLVVLHQINVAIAALREKQGLEPIDDPVPGEPDNAFRIIKALFMKFPATAREKTDAPPVPCSRANSTRGYHE